MRCGPCGHDDANGVELAELGLEDRARHVGYERAHPAGIG